MNPLSRNFFNVVGSIKYFSNSSQSYIYVKGESILLAVEGANNYLFQLDNIFKELRFNFYQILGQRNLSGFIGEVFSKYLSLHEPLFKANPHADGRPDLLDLSSSEAINYYNDSFTRTKDNNFLPIRANFAPFKYGGLEVKCSIGTTCSSYKNMLKRFSGSTEFEIGMERVKYLSSITYWAHHQSCDNLLGLYFDYPSEAGGIPQILAVFHTLLDTNNDWTNVSIGKKGSKKTSNTSLTSTGKKKIYNGSVVVTNLQRYSEKFIELGIRILSE